MTPPRADPPVKGPKPYQYPLTLAGNPTPATKGATRGLWGFLKASAAMANITNGIDFVRDLGATLAAWRNPAKTLGERLKSSAVLLFHGAGMFGVQLNSAYEMAQGVLRTADDEVRASGGLAYAMLPPFELVTNGVPNRYDMQHLQPVFSSPYIFNQFPSYGLYPPPPLPDVAFRPAWLGGERFFGQPFPTYPYGTNPRAHRLPLGNTFIGSSSAQAGAAAGPQAPAPRRLGVTPLCGGLLNGIDFTMDVQQVINALRGNPPEVFLKSAAELLFHASGLLVLQVGAAHGLLAQLERLEATAQRGELPAFAFDGAGHPLVYKSAVIS